jgi:excisionase family DNA binding protein
MATSTQLLKVGEVAERLQMTADGVYKLIQRGRLATVKISERKTRVPEREFNRYYDELQARADRYIAAQRRITPAEARAEFEHLTGRTPEAWLESWKRDELEDSAENMELYTRVVSIRSAEAQTRATT